MIGAGLSGLTAAWRLRAAGIEAKIFEKSAWPGGRTRSVRKDGFVFDTGAITMLPTYDKILALVSELGIGKHLHKMTPVLGIPRNGQIHRLDLGRPLRTVFGTRLISTGAKLRMLKLIPPLLRAWKLVSYESLGPLAPWDGETIAQYLRRQLDEDINEYIAGPIIRGNTLNDTDSAPFGELLWMLRQYAAPHLYGFDQGMSFLAESLAGSLPVTYETEILSVEKRPGGVAVHGQAGAQKFTETFDACIIALPPAGLRALAPNLTLNQRLFLDSITPLPSVNVHLGLRRKPAATETFILPPASEQPILTTIVMDHLKAPGRAPAGKGVVSLFCRDDWSARNFHAPDENILAEVLALAQPFIGDVRSDLESYVIARWPYAIIKSDVGLYHRIRAYEADIDPHDRIQIAGDFLSMGMESAVISGNSAAMRIAALFTNGGSGAERAERLQETSHV
jgi:protoporphyrinogen oxidase